MELNDPDMDLGVSVMNSLFNRAASKMLPDFAFTFSTAAASHDDLPVITSAEDMENHEPSAAITQFIEAIHTVKAKAKPPGNKGKTQGQQPVPQNAGSTNTGGGKRNSSVGSGKNNESSGSSPKKMRT